MKILLFLISAGALMALGGFFFNRNSDNSSASGDSRSLKEIIDEGAYVVDVRTPMEFQMGHYQGADNIPLDQVQARMNEFGPKDRTVVVYCRSGNRSGQAKVMLEAAGYENVINGGGLSDMPD